MTFESAERLVESGVLDDFESCCLAYATDSCLRRGKVSLDVYRTCDILERAVGTDPEVFWTTFE